MADNTIFDSVFKTMVHKAPQLLVPFVNESFGCDYATDEQVVQFSDEHQTAHGTIIDDSAFGLGGKVYHIECQSTPDANMVVRMIAYDFAIALERTLEAGAPYEMDFPESCVLFLRHTDTTPNRLEMRVNLPGGGPLMYRAGVVKAQVYTGEEILGKQLLVLAPYYLMRYEQALGEIAGDEVRESQLVAECSELRAGIERLALEIGGVALYEQLVELIIRVSDYLFEPYENLRRKVRAAMGGEVLELWSERAERLEREAEARGLEQGLEQGREQGLEQGLEQGREQGLEQGREQGIGALAALLEDRGMDRRVIDEAIGALRLQRSGA